MSGKLAMAVNNISIFIGDNAVLPKLNEICEDDNYLYIWKELGSITPSSTDVTSTTSDGTKVIAISKEKELKTYLDKLEAAGVFTSSASFVNNRTINRFYYDTDNGVVRIDPDRTFDPLYKYYAIRKIDPNSTSGSYEYITGVSGTSTTSGDITSALVNMDTEDSASGDGTEVSVPQVGGLVTEVTDGNSYIVEFYDTNKRLVNIETFQAIATHTADTDLCPDTAVTDMIITSNQQYDSDTIYYYQGQDVGAIELAVSLKYADGRIRDVTNEEANGGRLAISGLDEVDTSTLTGDSTPGTITVTYTMVRSNASFTSNSAYTTTSGAVISPSSLTIKKEVNVRIISDVVDDLESLIPVGYIIWDKTLSTPAYRIKMKYFGHYSNGVVNDITSIVKYSGTGLVDTDWGITQTLTVQVPYGNAGLYKNFTFTVLASNDPASSSDGSLKVKVYGNSNRFIVYNSASTGGGLYSGQFTAFETMSDSTMEQVSAANLLKLTNAQYGSIAPTHIRIRDVIDPTYFYTDIVDPTNNNIYYTVNGTDHALYADRPLLIEFFHIETDVNGVATSTFITGAISHYAIPASS